MSKFYGNVLLNLLSSHVAEELASDLQRVRLEPLQLLATRSETLPHIYFPETAVIGVLASAAGTDHQQIGLIGREGVINHAYPSVDDRMPWTMQVQVSGSAWRIDAKKLASSAKRHEELHAMLIRADRVAQIQLASSGVSAPRRGIEARIAKWLLMYFDRLNCDELGVTHDALAFVVDARRPSITEALHVLEGEGMITCKRGSVVLRNRQDLIKVSGPLYGMAEAEYQRLLGVNFREAESCRMNLSVPEVIVTGSRNLFIAPGPSTSADPRMSARDDTVSSSF